MRTLAMKPKAQETIPIPADLTAFLAEVHQLIVDRDEATIHESDDMLQAECAHGGLIEEGNTQYGFTYFPGDGIEAEWELVLDKADITRIAGNQQRELPLWACQVQGCGNKFSDQDGVCFEHDYDAG